MDQMFDPADQDGAAMDADAKRNAPRDSTFLNVDLRRSDRDAALTLRVRNLSPGGMMVETFEPFVRGEAVSATLRNVGKVAAKIAWVSSGRVGVAFDRAIDPREVRRTPQKSAGSSMMLVKVDGDSRRPGLKIG